VPDRARNGTVQDGMNNLRIGLGQEHAKYKADMQQFIVQQVSHASSQHADHAVAPALRGRVLVEGSAKASLCAIGGTHLSFAAA
jgi:hypothetical protein